MIRKLYLINIIIFCQIIFINLSFSSIKIIASINNEIITNYDVLKEINYLKILNPNLDNLDNNQLFELGKQSLIKELIKKKEISKYIDLSKKDEISNDYLNILFTNLGYKNNDEFKKVINNIKTYSFEEIKSKSKIEIYWNELIISKYNDKIKINEKKLKKLVDNLPSQINKQFLLSEIVFKKKSENNLIEEIKNSINRNGFNNAANIYSIADSSKYGGKIGWIDENSLSKKIYEKIYKLQINEISDVITIDNLQVILKVDDIKNVYKKIDKEKELQNLILAEKNKKLENYSIMHFNKIKSEYLINEK
jgi:peptidyl-prolyl cis-trans isomerase SurA